jgi:predicted esterase
MLGDVRPTHFVIWAGSLATDMDQAQFAHTLRHVKTTFVCGTDDEFFSPALVSRMSAQLSRIGIEHSVRTFVGTHTLDAAVLGPLLEEVAGPTAQ